MPTLSHIDPHSVHALVVVSAKEHGKIYEFKDGNITFISYTDEHPPSYSDNEGFFTTSTKNTQLGSGNVREESEEENIQQYIKAITEELRGHVETIQPEMVFVFEPEHLKGLVEKHLVTSYDLPIHAIQYGNYVEAEPEIIESMIYDAFTEQHDPTDPKSVAGEKNAAEKRKILEVGKKISG